MMFPRKRRVILLTLLYCCAAALICGVWSTAYPRRFGDSTVFEQPRLVSGDDDAILSSSEIWTAGARSLTSTDEVGAEPQASQEVIAQAPKEVTEVVPQAPQEVTEVEPQASQEVIEVESQSSEEEAGTVDLLSALPKLYHSPQIFALNYGEMAKNLRVYMYPTSQTGPKNKSYEYGVAKESSSDSDPSVTTAGFFNRLAKSTDFLTQDPDEAHLFFLPVSIDAVHAALGPAVVGSHLRDYIDTIRGEYNFWNQSLGADHFYLQSHAYDTINHRNLLELQKNAVQVACSPLEYNQSFYPHKDIVLPHYLKTPETEDLPREHSSLAYVNADLATSQILPQAWKSDSQFLVEGDSSPSPSAIRPKLAASKFCISSSMRNVVDALRLGCVPVLVSDSVIYDLPFQDIVNWREFSLVIGVEEMASLKTVLAEMGEAKYVKMQYLGKQASKHMEWNDPPVAYDAFHLTMFELWMRRFSVKYARYSDTS